MGQMEYGAKCSKCHPSSRKVRIYGCIHCSIYQLFASTDRWSCAAIHPLSHSLIPHRGHLARSRVNEMRQQEEAARRRSSILLSPAPEAFQLVDGEMVVEIHDELDTGILDPNIRWEIKF